jgi:hypothetical protein
VKEREGRAEQGRLEQGSTPPNPQKDRDAKNGKEVHARCTVGAWIARGTATRKSLIT